MGVDWIRHCLAAPVLDVLLLFWVCRTARRFVLHGLPTPGRLLHETAGKIFQSRTRTSAYGTTPASTQVRNARFRYDKLSSWLQILNELKVEYSTNTSSLLHCSRVKSFTYVNTEPAEVLSPRRGDFIRLTVFARSHRFRPIPHRWPMRPGPRGRGSASPRVSRTGAFAVGRLVHGTCVPERM